MSDRIPLQRFLIGLTLIGALIMAGCKGATGPEGLVEKGRVSGKITVFEDAVFSSGNSPSLIGAGGFTVSVVGDSTRTGSTAPDGSYSISDVPGGTYVIQISNNPDSPIGYGTMKRYNFFVGGGSSFHSGVIGRKAPKPSNVSAAIDSIPGTGLVGIRVAWSITPPSLQFTTFTYVMTFRSSTVSASAVIVGSGALSDTSLVVGLPPSTYTVAVQGDIGFGYIDESNGESVFPTRSQETAAPNSVTLTRPLVVNLNAKKLEKAYPGRRLAVAEIVE